METPVPRQGEEILHDDPEAYPVLDYLPLRNSLPGADKEVTLPENAEDEGVL